MVIFVCIGDCKLLLWNETKGTIDVTLGNRVNARSASDSGGRLGPYVESGHADLRNLRAYFSPCKLGDYLIVVTDGVYDNFDPGSEFFFKTLTHFQSCGVYSRRS